MNQDLLFLKETQAILNFNQEVFGMTKTAGLTDEVMSFLNGSVLSSVTSFAKSQMQEQFSGEAPGGHLTDFLSVIAAGTLWNVHPLLGVIYGIANEFGFNLQTLVTKIFDYLKPKIESGSISTSDITEAAESAAGVSVDASHIDFLNNFVKYNQMKTAGIFDDFVESKYSTKSKPGLMDKVLGDRLTNALKSQGKGKARRVILGLVIWVLKTFLKGFGILAVGGMVGSLFKNHLPKAEEKIQETTQNITQEVEHSFNKVHDIATNVPDKIKEVKTGPQRKFWIVPLFGSVENTLKLWTIDLYPKLKEYDNISDVIYQSSDFKDIVRKIKSKPENITKNQMVMPEEFTNRKQIVDTFITDILRNL
jgi:ribosomal protein L9